MLKLKTVGCVASWLRLKKNSKRSQASNDRFANKVSKPGASRKTATSAYLLTITLPLTGQATTLSATYLSNFPTFK
jgi:hypothetical protein